MKVVLEHDKKNNSYLRQYATHIQQLSLEHSLLEVQEKHLAWLRGLVKCAEPDFEILLHSQILGAEDDLLTESIIIVYIGSKKTPIKADAYYNIKTRTLEKATAHPSRHVIKWIHCYSQDNRMGAVDYIQCIRYLKEKSREWHRPVIIYGDIEVADEKYRYRSLTNKVISQYLKEINGVLITRASHHTAGKYDVPSKEPFEVYHNHILYEEENLEHTIKKALAFLDKAHNCFRMEALNKFFHRQTPLYKDAFYQSIPLEQMIYVVPSYGAYKSVQYYADMGITAVEVAEDYRVLYAPRSVFDTHSEVLKTLVIPQYQMPVLSAGLYSGNEVSKIEPYRLVTEELAYKGEGVYIGFVGIDGVDYTNEVLRTPEGKTRIACIWEQDEAGEGNFYFREQINEALISDTPEQIVPISENNGITTALLGIAGGKSTEKGYEGIATEAEFLVAKIKPAPNVMQEIFGGVPTERAVLMPDILIGFSKLRRIATANGRPIVFCIPFNSNIDTHDGTFILNNVVEYIGERPGVTVVVPAGEEADKMHHATISGNQSEASTIGIRVDRMGQNVVGIICQKVATITGIRLEPPAGVEMESVNLKESAVTRLGLGAEVYSSGTHINFSNGTLQMLFRINAPETGEWKLRIELDPVVESLIDIWISQQTLNPYITLSPANPLKTVGSTACINIISSGAYNRESMVVIRSSGRGFSWSNQVRPRLVTDANNIIGPYKKDRWVSVTGTLPATSIMAGVAATLYSKFMKEDMFPLPNTLVMDSILLGVLRQFEGVEYPNPSQGYGIFDRASLAPLLATFFVL
ncbi:MAG: hypothetical protein K0S30_115 [Clostridia bacterium]|jgi:hypothetical protein|nr:hypothetical protein [Clostridia bacterium]